MIILTEFQKKFMKKLNFKAIDKGFSTLFIDESNKDSGYLIFASKPDCYTLILADYTIPRDFELDFSTTDCQLRFGLVYDGISEYQVHNKPVTNFMPAPFIAIEDHLSGHQKWKKGRHYQGIELFIDTTYIKNNLASDFPDTEHILNLQKNNVFLYLPLGVMDILRLLKNLMLEYKLRPLLLEAKVLECLALISTELADSGSKAFLNPTSIVNVPITSERSLQLTSTDIASIHSAQKLIAENLADPPTISSLCKTLYINEQKLTAGFRKIYHMTIGNYIKDLRLSTAANLLSSTDLSIDLISDKVGYSHSSNFGKAFKSKYKRTPLQYRKFRSRTNK